MDLDVRTLLPQLALAKVLVAPPRGGSGPWAGAASAVVVGDDTYVAYRVRLPVGEGRGISNVVARLESGWLRTLAVVERDRFGAESLERPALVRTPGGRWRLYVSCATPGTKHWRVDLLEADTVEGLAQAVPSTVLPGNEAVAVKDPVIVLDGGRWHLWAAVHPLERWDDADRMTTDYATSDDGVAWTWHGTVLAGRPGEWDARGARVTSVQLDGDRLLATYDGRATAEQNWEEVTGTAVAQRLPDGRFGEFLVTRDAPLSSPHGGLRYVTSAGGQVMYELTRPDGAHELRLSAPAG